MIQLLEQNFLNGLSDFGKSVISRPENTAALTKAILDATGKQMQVKCIEQSQNNSSESDIDSLVNGLDIPINIIEE